MAFYQALPWHKGEEEVHRLTHVPISDNPTHPMLSGPLARRISLSPTIALGVVDSQGRVWCSIWGGDVPIAQQVAKGVIGIRTHVDISFDPVVEVLYGGKTDGEVVRDNKMVSGLSIHLEQRDRVKFFGQMIAGSLNGDDNSQEVTDMDTATKSNSGGRTGNAQVVLHVSQSLGNCPKYINKKIIKAHPHTKPYLISDLPHLTHEAIVHIHNADTFFIASCGPEDMDCNIRGGSPGFLRVLQQPETIESSPEMAVNGSTLIWPEYSGNNLYQTLGNLSHSPRAGICIPNFTTGTVLYLTGTTEILIGTAASAVLTKTKLAVRFTVTAARFVSDSLCFRGSPSTDNSDVSSSRPRVDRPITNGMSPYNPKVRYLVSELADQEHRINTVPPDEFRDRTVEAWREKDEGMIATLVKKDAITPTIMKYRFRIDNAKDDNGNLPLWTPGQYVALDFSEELYMGYSHMRDDDPGSLNDDFIRTFTVANMWTAAAKGNKVEFEVVVRTVGTVTKWLNWQNESSGMTKLGVRGFAGDFRFEMARMAPSGDDNSINLSHENGKRKNVFVAAGIGITPLMGQVDLMKDDELLVLWTVHVKDIGLVEEIVKTFSKMKGMNIYVTGTTDEAGGRLEERLQQVEKQVEGTGISIQRRRLEKQDLAAMEENKGVQVEHWYLCTAPKMRAEIQEWLEGRVVIFENFGY